MINKKQPVPFVLQSPTTCPTKPWQSRKLKAKSGSVVRGTVYRRMASGVKSPGFSLIEIIIAIAISSLVGGILFFSFNQVQKSVKIIEQMLSIDPRIMTISNQFEKDISGAFVPQYWFPVEEKTGAAGAEGKLQIEADPKKSGANQVQPGKNVTPSPKVEYKKIDKVFFSSNQGDNLKELTFITCNPFQTYNNYKPRIARVQYTLVSEEDNKNAFKLLRKESPELDFEKFNKEKAIEYELSYNIKSFKISYIYPEKPKESESTEKKKQEEVKYKDINAWEKKSDSKEDEMPDIPQFIKLNITLWDISLDQEFDFEIRYQVFAFKDYPQEKPRGASSVRAQAAASDSR